ncbi:MAG: KUP/HAK/KT family potassium transporter [Deltaproteobacteria bacterium]|nr:KUP/HAK/KT family potassium transporter [Deltaproteobacteria bacterium]
MAVHRPLPCLLLNYFGQGAYLLGGNEVPRENVFYALAPDWGRIPLLILATFATIVASQALISGAFSLTQQAVALGLFPRVKIVHTNPAIPGQIYMPFINFALFAGCVWLVLAFRSSSDLAAAYGIAVSCAMVVTTLVFTVVARRVWGWRRRWLYPAIALILFVDGAFLGANLLKFTSGGYVPVVIGFAIFAMMDTWRWGRQWIGIAYQRRGGASPLTLAEVLENRAKSFDPGQSTSLVVMASRPVTRVEDTLPPVFAVHYRNWKRVPKHIVFFSVIQVGAPFVDDEERYKVITLSHDEAGTVVSVLAYFGYMEQPNVRKTLAELKSRHQLKIPQESRKWLILLGAERFVTRGRNPLEQLRISLFSRMNRLAKPVTDYFGLETDMGVTIETINV